MQNNSILRNLIALNLVPGFGPKRVKLLLEKYPDPNQAFKLSKTELRSIEGVGEATALSFLSFEDWEEVDKTIEATEKTKAKVLTIVDDNYPELLKQIYDPPILIWHKGDIDLLHELGVAVVGTRNTTSYGKKTAKKLAADLCEAGLCIFSGLAHGIDSYAHQAAVESGGKTVAVLGSGIDWIYPAKNKGLANAIVQSGGLVISEFPPGTKPDAGNFPIRNRIVSGLSLGTLVVESGIQGGSIITAEIALDQNREVFAVPHPIDSASGTGCNYLIKNGAKLVQTVDDILEELPIEGSVEHRTANIKHTTKSNWRDQELDDLSKRVCELLEEKEYQIDALADEIGASTSQLLVAMLTLEMKHIVSQKAGKVFELK
jgi:DNA processing protein